MVRRGPVQFHEAIQIRQPDMHQRLLPIISDSSTAAFGSPLAEYIHPEQDETPDLVIPPTASTEALEHTSDIVSHLLNPAGPWKLRFNVPIPDCHSHIHITNKVQGARIVVTHRLRITLRVSTGLAEQTGSNEKLKLFDIIVDAPVHLLSVRVSRDHMRCFIYAERASNLFSLTLNLFILIYQRIPRPRIRALHQRKLPITACLMDRAQTIIVTPMAAHLR